MQGIIVPSIIIAISVIRSESLSQDATGVCSETKTTNVMTTETFTGTYTRSYTSCDLLLIIPICSTKYRLATRTQSRSVYKTVENNFLTCCPGYVEVEDKCKSEATTEVITTQSPVTTSASSTSLASLLSSTSTEQSIFSNFPSKNKSPLTVTLIISGFALFVIVIIIGLLALLVFAVMRKKRIRPETTSRPPQKIEGRNGRESNAHYYTDIPENETGYSGVVPSGESPQHPTPSTSCKQTTENMITTIKKLECTYNAVERQQKAGMVTPKQCVEVKPQSSGNKCYNKVIHAEKFSTELCYDELESSYHLQTNQEPIYD